MNFDYDENAFIYFSIAITSIALVILFWLFVNSIRRELNPEDKIHRVNTSINVK